MKKNVHSKLIFIDGCDRVGKDSLHEAIDKLTNYNHQVSNRSIISNLMYAKKYHREEQINDAIDCIKDLSKLEYVLFIYIDADTDELIRRCKNTNHPILDYDKEKESYEKSINYAKKIIGEDKFTKIKSTKETTPESLAQELIDKKLI